MVPTDGATVGRGLDVNGVCPDWCSTESHEITCRALCPDQSLDDGAVNHGSVEADVGVARLRVHKRLEKRRCTYSVFPDDPLSVRTAYKPWVSLLFVTQFE